MMLNQNRSSLLQQRLPARHLQPAYYDYDHAQPPSTASFDPDLSALDLETEFDYHSLSSSPVSTQSLLSQYSNIESSPLSAFDSIPTPTLVNDCSLFPQPPRQSGPAVSASSTSFLGTADAMQTEAWAPNGQLTPRSVGRFSHNRESSRSSLGSNGPASPFSHNFSNPQIAVNDTLGDTFPVYHGTDDLNNYQLATKSFPGVTHDNFYAGYPAAYGSTDNASIQNSYPYIAPTPTRRRNNRGLLLPSDHHPIGSSRSQPVSVASSIASDSPATPAGEPEEDKRRNTALPAVPKLDRTMTDIYNDELYNPNFTIASSTSGPVSMSPTSDLFKQRVQAANNQHLSAVTNSPVSATSRDRSPFQQSSPLAALPMHDFPAGRFGSAQQLREQNKAMHDVQAMQRQIARSTDTSTPQTISPKDAMLDYQEPEGEANFPLFPQQNTNRFNADAANNAAAAAAAAAASAPAHPAFQAALSAMDQSTFNHFLNSQMQAPPPVQVPQQYPFVPQARSQSAVTSVSNGTPATTRFGSAETGAESVHSSTPQRVDDTRANGGTYTCTYHGCTQRFATPALLQKHKREGHRQAHGLGGPGGPGARRPDPATMAAVGAGMSGGMTSALLNTQAGPHRCDRLNPSTGKPCNAVFSRPYDLTRHEGTIHNPHKQKVRCDLCTDDKTFSRADALTRHYKVCHPDMELPGKHRRRGGHGTH